MLAVHFGMFWILGLLIGGVVGYFSYDFKGILKAIPVAWKYASIEINKISFNEIFGNLVKITKRVINTALAIIGVIGIPVASFFFFIRGFSLGSENELLGISDTAPVMFLIITIGAFISFCCLFNLFLIFDCYTKKKSEKSVSEISGVKGISEFAQRNKFFMVLLMIFCMPIMSFIIVRFIVINVPTILKVVKVGVVFTGKFLWKFFKLVHSDLRFLVGVDSMVGGAVGMYFNNMLIGMIVGAGWGFINYYFVSLRILKLKPVH